MKSKIKSNAKAIFTAPIATDKTLACDCFREIFHPNEEVKFAPEDIFYIEEDWGKKQAFAFLLPRHDSNGHDCPRVVVPLYLLCLTDDQKFLLHVDYKVPMKYFVKEQVAMHVELESDEELETAELGENLV